MTGCASCGRPNRPEAHFCDACGAALETRGPESPSDLANESRKTVTVVFSDVTGSTALGESLDPESLRRVLARYFAAMRQVIERHGGTVEKFIGDAVMAVFGVPTVHEDDALRAVRAAWEMSAALTSLNDELATDYGTRLQARIGVNTGEVVTGTEERLATGDTVNVAARLEQRAEPGWILLGEQTFRLTHRAVTAVAVEPLTVKGKAQPVPAYRLVGVPTGSPVQGRAETQLVGRTHELRLLRGVFEHAVRDRSCRLVTVVGAAGIGKSRLAREFVATVDHATLVTGRCLSYGEGITYWPVVEALAPLAARLPALSLEVGVMGTIQRLLDGDAAASTDEIAWAFRKLLEAVALEAPVILLLDDIQWAEDAFLDLIDQFALLSRGAAITVVCLARPDLLDRRPGWAVDVKLEPLGVLDAERLVEQCLAGASIDPEARQRILRSAGGNALFVEELTAMVDASGGGAIAVPPTIQALLAARLEQLPPEERRVIGPAAVEGEVFHRTAVQALLPSEHGVMGQIAALVRKDLVLPHPSEVLGEDAFRFRHLLIRDAAYESLPKALRAQLHEGYARWLEDKMGERRLEVAAIVGHHLEQACRYLAELGPADGHARELAITAGTVLASAGNKALARGDGAAAINLLQRAVSLIPEDDPARPRTLLRLGHAYFNCGDVRRGRDTLDDTIELADACSDQAVGLRARIERSRLLALAHPQDAIDRSWRLAEDAIPVLEQLHDDEGLGEAWWAVADGHAEALQLGLQSEALERSLTHARKAGDEEQAAKTETWMAVAWTLGPTPASQMLRAAERLIEEGEPTPRRETWWLILAGFAKGLLGHADEARELFSRAAARAEAVSGFEMHSGALQYSGMMEMIVGDARAAERDLRAAYELQAGAGLLSFSSTLAAQLALALYAQGRYAEVEELVEVSRSNAAASDIASQAYWRQAMAKVLARRGAARDAVQLAGEAIEMLEATDGLMDRADAFVDLAAVLDLVGRGHEAVDPLQRALALYEQKESVVSASRIRADLTDRVAH